MPKTFVRPDGRISTIAPQDVELALSRGYRPETPEEIHERGLKDEYGEDFSSELLAGLAGAARGLTFGLSDYALVKSGLAEQETLRALKEYNPLASVAGEVVGVAAPMVLTGGGSLAARGIVKAGVAVRGVGTLGRATERTVAQALTRTTVDVGARKMLARALPKAAGGFAEGVAYGAGQSISEAALGDPQEAAENLLAHIGLSGLLGAGAGALFGGIAGAAKLTKDAGAKKILQAAQDHEENLRKPVKGFQDWLDKVAGRQALRAIRPGKAEYEVLKNRKKLGELEGFMKRHQVFAPDGPLPPSLETMNERLNSIVKNVDEQRTLFVSELDGLFYEQMPRSFISPFEVGRRVKKNVRKDFTGGDREQVGRMIDGKIADINIIGPEFITFKEAARHRADFRQKGWIKQGSREDALNRISDEWNKYIDETADTLLVKVGKPAKTGHYRDLRNEQFLAMKAARISDKALSAARTNRTISPSDYAVGLAGMLRGQVGAAAVGATFGFPAGLAAALGHKFIRERGSAAIAYTAYRASKLDALGRVVERTAKTVNKAVDDFAAGKAKALAVPSTVSIYSGASYSERRAKKSEEKGELYKQRFEELRRINASPGAMARRLDDRLRAVNVEAPNITAALGVKASLGAQFLYAKAPRNPMSAVHALTYDWRPSDAEIDRWGRYIRAVEDPLSTLDDLKGGTLTTEGVEAVKIVYPRLYRQILTRLMERMAEAESVLPYRDRVQISTLFGVPVDATVRPEFVSQAQQQVRGPEPEEPTAPQAQRAFERLTLARRTRTRAQQLSEGLGV